MDGKDRVLKMRDAILFAIDSLFGLIQWLGSSLSKVSSQTTTLPDPNQVVSGPALTRLGIVLAEPDLDAWCGDEALGQVSQLLQW